MHACRAIVVVLVLIGGLLAPSGQILLAAPAAVVAVTMIVWEILRTMDRGHWVIVFVPLLFGLLAFQRMVEEPMGAYGEAKFTSLITLTAFSSLCACLIRSDGFLALARVWVFAALYLTAASLITGVGARAAAFGANPIWVSRALAAGLVLTAWLYWTRQLRGQWALLIGIILFVGLFASGSRGPLSGAAAGVLVLVLASNARAVKKFFILAVVSVGSLSLLRLPFFQESRIVAVTSGEEATESIRTQLWSESLRLMWDRPDGVGFGNWAAYTNVPFQFDYPHNLFLEVLTELGMAVGILFMLLVLWILFALMRKARTSPTALVVSAWLVAEIVNVCVSGDINARTFFFVLTLGFLVVADCVDGTTSRTAGGHRSVRVISRLGQLSRP